MHADSTPAGRLIALGQQLVEIHLWLLDELDQLRAGLDGAPPAGAGRPPADPDGRPPADPDGGPPAAGRLRSLRAHCLSFCSALTRHHTGEDAGAFRVLADEVPELRPVLDRLTQDHRMVDWIVRRIEALVADPPTDDPAALDRVRDELDGLGAILGSHFRYEERTLTAALDALGDRAGGTEELLGVEPPPDW
ncbi:hemerythrin domain-containing protein [Micromonospora sp. NPDC051925]|uniref:hemerythrin domain-containing protein n=1 Tax=Micromonospora sp. NPDC051925 TaxID=3364288 RepID=UPI0037C7CF41